MRLDRLTIRMAIGPLLPAALALLLVLPSGCKHEPTKDKSADQPAAQAPAPSPEAVPAKAETQEPVVAGQFYDADPDKLRSMVDGFIGDAEPPKLPGLALGFMVPHAGHIFSGPVAGYAYKEIKDSGVKRFVIMGPSHHVPFRGVYVMDKDFYRTPLGTVKIDRSSVKKLASARSWISTDPRLYDSEHSVEVQIPFLQEAVGPGLSIVPMVIGYITDEQAADLAKALDETFPGNDVIFIASSDMSHGNYPPFKSSDMIRPVDLNTLKLVTAMDVAAIARGVRDESTPLCGGFPVLTLMHLFKLRGGSDVEILKYADSGDATGDHSKVVGYGAAAFVLSAAKAREGAMNTGENSGSAEEGGFKLSDQEKIELLKMARVSAEAAVKKQPQPEMQTQDDNLKRIGAAFVTLKNQGELRGCIGAIIPNEPLYLCVQRRAVDAAIHDSRFFFHPITQDELSRLEIEISVLTPLETVKSLDDVKVGRDGVLLTLGYNRGVFLPQVPTEQGWDRETYLEELCHKAGIADPNCFRDPAARLEKFQAIVFSEREMGL